MYALGKETKALKLLSESLAFNGPLRYSTYFCYFGNQTAELMEIYVRFLNKGVKFKKKTYRKATELISSGESDYMDYIHNILTRSRKFEKEETNPFCTLTSQELRILNCLAKGMTNLQISDHLQISIATVKTHISNLFSKLGVKNRSAAVREAVTQGYLKTTL